MAEKRSKKENVMLRVLHASRSLGNVDVFIHQRLFLGNFSYKSVCSYASLPSGRTPLLVYPSGSYDQFILTQQTLLEAEGIYTIALAEAPSKKQLYVFQSHPEVPVGEAKIRFLNLAVGTLELDIAVKNRDVIFSKISWGHLTEYLGITPMTVDLEARIAGSKETLLDMPKMKFSPNHAYTVVIAGDTKATPSLEAILLID